MKNKLMILTTILCLSTISIYAQSVKSRVDTVCITTIQNSIETKECIINDERTGKPLKKRVYVSEVSGKRLETVFYLWERYRSWVAYRRTEYKYDDNSVLSKVVNLKWDDINSVWSNKKEQSVSSNLNILSEMNK